MGRCLLFLHLQKYKKLFTAIEKRLNKLQFTEPTLKHSLPVIMLFGEEAEIEFPHF